MIQPRHAILRGEPGNVALEVLLVPFYWKNEWVDTAIRLDGINLPSAHLADLAGKTFLFPLIPMQKRLMALFIWIVRTIHAMCR